MRAPTRGSGIVDRETAGTAAGTGTRGSAAGRRRPGPSSSSGLGQPAQRPGQRVDHVGQAARLGPWLALGGEHRDTHRHRPMLPAPAARDRSLNRFTHPTTPVSSPPWSPSSACPSARRLRPPAAAAGGPAPPRLQPLLDLAPPGAGPVRAHRQPAPGRATAAPSRSCRHGRLVASCSTTPTSWPSTRRSSPTSTATSPTARTTGSSASTASELDGPDRLLLRRVRAPRVAGHLLRRPRRARRRPHEGRLATWPSRSSASGCSTATATSARRSTPTATRSTPTPTTTCRACRCTRVARRATATR